ncbi:conserved hypothetical protein [Xanthomonas campestris pv. campestris str. 8004]|uniref:Uncharacterized protein n=3 Tax=Xanthomonas campestris TaxID=339 RepID=A0A0H2X8U9_XANC8|nr:conserved hypothetical protein [Xanthomonas campestris pv. campestris str. 8004]
MDRALARTACGSARADDAYGVKRGDTLGSGTIVGVADLVDCIGPFDATAWRAHADKHCIPIEREELAMRWNVAWALSRATPLARSVSYDHPSGAVTWVNLDDEVVAQLQLGASHLKIPQKLPLTLGTNLQPKNLPEQRFTLEDAGAVPIGVLIPVASDGTWFSPDLKRGRGYTICAKGEEIVVESYLEALSQLRLIPKPRWRRPNAGGNWGIMTGVKWEDASKLTS